MTNPPLLSFVEMHTDTSPEYRRAKIPGGWLVQAWEQIRTRERDDDRIAVSCSVTFVPDPKHEWDGGSL